MSWTKGPWAAFHTDNAGGPYSEVRIGTHPAEGGKMLLLGGDYMAIATMRNGRHYGEVEANCELIALAPGMAELVMEHAAYLRGERDGGLGTDAGKRIESFLAMDKKLRTIGQNDAAPG